MATAHYHIAIRYAFARPRHAVRYAPPPRGMFTREQGYTGHTVTGPCSCATPNDPPAAWWAEVAA